MNLLRWFSSFFGKNKEEVIDPNMKYLIVGLGNMGAKYDNTRHNIGFDVIDTLASEYKLEYKHANLGDVAEFRFKGRVFVLLKPSTYMNLSGKAVRYWLQKKKIKQENLLVIVDDLNIDFGGIRLRGKGSDGGHNGLKNINELLGTKDYARLRIGIGDNFSKGGQVNFVLGKWSPQEQEQLVEVIDHCVEAVKAFGTIGLARTMSQFNKKA